MLQQEFEERTGIKVSAVEYEGIQAMYMNTNLNKDDFCKEYPKIKDSIILKEVQMTAESYKKVTTSLNDAQFATAYFLADQAAKCKDLEVREELRSKAINLIGCKAYLRYILEMGYELTQLDKEALLMILNKN